MWNMYMYVSEHTHNFSSKIHIIYYVYTVYST